MHISFEIDVVKCEVYGREMLGEYRCAYYYANDVGYKRRDFFYFWMN